MQIAKFLFIRFLSQLYLPLRGFNPLITIFVLLGPNNLLIYTPHIHTQLSHTKILLLITHSYKVFIILFFFPCHLMAPLLISLLFLFMFPSGNNGQGGPPSPGYYPSSRIGSLGFNQGFRNLWGPQHQRLDQSALTIWLDRSSGHSLLKLVWFHVHTTLNIHI